MAPFEGTIKLFRIVKNRSITGFGNIIHLTCQGNPEKPLLQTIDRLLDLEIDKRRQARIELRFKQLRLLEQPTIDQFNFNHHPSRKNYKATVLGLLDLEFVRRKMDIIFIAIPASAKVCLPKLLPMPQLKPAF